MPQLTSASSSWSPRGCWSWYVFVADHRAEEPDAFALPRYIGVALSLIVTVPSSRRCRRTSSGPEATAVPPVLPKLSVTVPGPDVPKVISPAELTAPSHVSYSLIKLRFSCFNLLRILRQSTRHPGAGPGGDGAMDHCATTGGQGEGGGTIANPRVADSPGKPKIVASEKSKVSPARAGTIRGSETNQGAVYYSVVAAAVAVAASSP